MYPIQSPKVKRTESSVNTGKIVTTITQTRLIRIVWSSNEVHMVDALAVRGEERRDSLR